MLEKVGIIETVGSEFVAKFELFEILKNLGFSLFGGMIFWFSPFVLVFLWKKQKIKEIKSIVEALSPEEIENLMKNQEEPILNRNYCSKQLGKIIEVKPTRKRMVCHVLWYHEELPRHPSYQNFHYTRAKPTKEEFIQLGLNENNLPDLTTLVVITNKPKRAIVTGFWLKKDTKTQ